MTKSFWFGDAYQKGNFSNGKQDTFNPNKRYIGIRLQQGVPLLDRDWNELEDIRRNEEQMLRSWYIGDGIPGDTGFKIMPPDKQGDDFKINSGRCMVDGFLVINDSDILYSAQTEGEADADKISEMTKFFVYLDVWIEEVNGEGDPALKNDKDVKMETCVRHQLKWRVRVRSGKLVSKKNHHYYDLAKVERSQLGSIEVTNISDLRRTGLSLYRLRDALNVDKSGNVGIGTEKPSRPLHVEGEIHSSRGFCFADWTQKFVESPSKGERWAWYANGGIARLWTGEDKLSITHDGNVVIGTGKPGGKLSIYGVSTGQTGIFIQGSAGNSAIPWDDGSIILTGDISEKATGSFVFRSYDGKKYVRRFDIDGKTGNAILNHAAQTAAINTSKIGLELQSADGGGVIYGNGINHSIFFRVGRDGLTDVTDYHEFGSHRFFTDGWIQNQKERMRITKGGSIGIGIQDPGSYKVSIGDTDGQNVLHIASDFNLREQEKLNLIKFGTQGDYQILHTKQRGALGRNTLALHCQGDDAIGIYSSGWRPLFEVAGGTGDYYFRGKQITTSDLRLKTNIIQLTNVLSKVGRIRGVSFEWNELYDATFGRSNGQREIGLIAQEVEEVFPELVKTLGKEKYLGINYEKIVVLLVEAIKELKAKVDVLERKVQTMQQ